MLFLLYKILWWVILPWVLFFRYLKDKKSGHAGRYLFERLGFSHGTKQHDIILHAVSLGEVRAMTPLVLAILKEFPEHSVLITTTTLTGRKQIETTFGQSVSVAFLPHDIGFFIKRFLKKVQPKVLMIMETEIWPNLLMSCAKLNIQTYIISACLSERSQKGYLKFPKTIQKILNHVHVMTQTEEDSARFKSIGAKDVSVMGNLKYVITLPNDFEEQTKKLLKGKDDYLLWCVASTHDGEEAIVLDAFKMIQKQFPNVKLAIAPRHPERFEVVENLLQGSDVRYQKRSAIAMDEFTFEHHDVWLFDSIGELFYLYGASDIVTVAGSFTPIGGHNILEPAFLKKTITVGPYVDNITDMVESFEENNAIIVLNGSDITSSIKHLVTESELREKMGENAYRCIMQNQQSLPCVIQELRRCLKGK